MNNYKSYMIYIKIIENIDKDRAHLCLSILRKNICGARAPARNFEGMPGMHDTSTHTQGGVFINIPIHTTTAPCRQTGASIGFLHGWCRARDTGGRT